jgi:hypothetical protein
MALEIQVLAWERQHNVAELKGVNLFEAKLLKQNQQKLEPHN